MSKNFNSIFYTHGKFGKRIREVIDRDSEFLYALGIYPTKIKPEDLPENYIKIHSRSLWYMHGYLKTSDIVDIKYKYLKINHLFKDDYIYISYSKPIKTILNPWGREEYDDYDICISGNSIIPIILAAEKNSGIDITNIKALVEEKRIWYKEHCHDDYIMQFGDKDIDLFEYYK